MNRTLIQITILLSVIAACCCIAAALDNARTSIGETEVLPNTFDNGQGLVYIKVDNPVLGDPDRAMADIIAKESAWEKMFPAKNVTAISVISCTPTSYGSTTAIYGLLVHYRSDNSSA